MMMAERFHSSGWILCTVAAATLLPMQAALADTVSVTVKGSAQPWNTYVNPKMDFGLHDGSTPTMVWKVSLIPGTTIGFEADGPGTITVVDGAPLSPNGAADLVFDDKPGNAGALMPSAYMDSAQFPVAVNALVGAFVDADGKVVGKPFKIGRETKVVVPEGALAISLGMNDDRYADNGGSLDVTISTVSGEVTVEGAT